MTQPKSDSKELSRLAIWEMWDPENFVHPSGAPAAELDRSRAMERATRIEPTIHNDVFGENHGI